MQISSVSAQPGFSGITQFPGAAGSSSGASFGGMVQKMLTEANAQQLQADQAVQQLATGQSDSIHETMLAMAKADLSFRMLMEVQGKVVEAYQEVMRMQV